MFSAKSMGETTGAALGTSAQGVRETHRRGRGILRTAAALLLIVLLGAPAAAFAQQPTEQPTAEPPFIGDMMDEGIGRYNAGAPARALEMFLQAAQTDPNASEPWIWAGIAATAAGKMQDAHQYFTRGLARTHSPFQDRIVRGWLARLTVFTTAAPRPAKPGTPQAIASLARATNPRLSAVQAEWLGERLVVAAKQQRVDPWLVAAVIYVESRFNQASVSSRGARGLGQLMPHTARAAGVNPRDAWGNILGTAMTLSACIREFRDWRLALAAYNAGATAVYRYRGVPPFAETRWYVTAVLAVYRHIRPE
ncbi:MAG TPA: lytic transglycosylase domain-containing protein [bacterium]|nr:lytic transglycosylase domain-containing protein [bacterium]